MRASTYSLLRAMGLLLTLVATSGAANAASWQITGSACKPARDTVGYEKVQHHLDLSYQTVRAANSSLIVLHCPITVVNVSGFLKLAVYYQDTDGAGELARVDAWVYRMDKRPASGGGPISFVCSFRSGVNGNTSKTTWQQASTACSAAFDTDTYVYGAFVVVAADTLQHPRFFGMELWR